MVQGVEMRALLLRCKSQQLIFEIERILQSNHQ